MELQERLATKSEVLINLLNYAGEHNCYITEYPGIAEPGYDDKPMLCANWNPDNMSKIYNWAEKYFEDEILLDWDDEWMGCTDCNKAVRTTGNSYGWTAAYVIIEDYEVLCRECAKIYPDKVLDAYLNNSKRAMTDDFIQIAKDAGFHCPELEDCPRFENGWHPGQNDTPASVLEYIYRLFELDKKEFHDKFDYVFYITGVGQFDVHFTILIRKKVEGEKYE